LANGDIYVGEFKDGLRNGQGTLTYVNGDIYVGEFKDDLFNGQGTFENWYGRKKEGIWKEDKFLYKNIDTKKDEVFCLDIGFKLNTPEFDKCVQKSSEQH
ncbi:hypothetical protein OAI04_03520, partial [Hyphomicrobiales bacterium]|nr:hypothetical protein [Hyphomicrobiales bacterium]